MRKGSDLCLSHWDIGMYVSKVESGSPSGYSVILRIFVCIHISTHSFCPYLPRNFGMARVLLDAGASMCATTHSGVSALMLLLACTCICTLCKGKTQGNGAWDGDTTSTAGMELWVR